MNIRDTYPHHVFQEESSTDEKVDPKILSAAEDILWVIEDQDKRLLGQTMLNRIQIAMIYYNTVW